MMRSTADATTGFAACVDPRRSAATPTSGSALPERAIRTLAAVITPAAPRRAGTVPTASANRPAATARPAAPTPATGAPMMFPAKYAPRTIPRARPSSGRGVVDVMYAMMSGSPAVPDQYRADPTNAPCQSVSGTNVATPRAAQSHAAVITG